MAYPQSITFAGLPVIGLDGLVRRGTAPGVFRIRVPHDAALKVDAGDLVFESDGGTITFADCIPDLSTLRLEFRRDKREYVLLVYDRRKTWSGTLSTGRYNRRYRDGTIEAATEKTAGEIGDLILADLGETPASTASLGDIYPDCDWDGVPCDQAINQLLATVPGHLCRTADDEFEFRTTDDGDGIDAGLPAKNPDFLANIDSGPKTIRALCGKTWFQTRLELEAVGLETDGTWEVVDDLSYKPAGGWEKEWPTLFSGVAAAERPLALATVFRCYRPKIDVSLDPLTDADGESMTLDSLDDIDLDPYQVVFDATDPPPAYVTGTFWPYTDHPYNTANCPRVTCGFDLDRESKVITFDRPIFKKDDCISAATLYLHTGFHLRDASGGWIRQSYTDDRDDGSGEWTLDVPYLWRAQSVPYTDCTAGTMDDNETELDTEADVIVAAWKAHWDAVRNKRCVALAGLHKISLSGKIAEVAFRLGRGLTPQTRVAVHFEPKR